MSKLNREFVVKRIKDIHKQDKEFQDKTAKYKTDILKMFGKLKLSGETFEVKAKNRDMFAMMIACYDLENMMVENFEKQCKDMENGDKDEEKL